MQTQPTLWRRRRDSNPSHTGVRPRLLLALRYPCYTDSEDTGLVGLAQTHHPNLFDIQLIISSG